MPDLDAGGEVKEANWEYDGVAVPDSVVLAELFWVMDESRAGPGISV